MFTYKISNKDVTTPYNIKNEEWNVNLYSLLILILCQKIKMNEVLIYLYALKELLCNQLLFNCVKRLKKLYWLIVIFKFSEH